jgi:isocitrate dehydrogenase
LNYKPFYPVARIGRKMKQKINEELIEHKGKPQEIGGYQQPDAELTSKSNASKRNVERYIS